MRVYIAGSHSSGKSTLARYISEKYELKFLPEIARTVLAEKELNIDSLRNNIDIVDDYQKTIFLRQIREEALQKDSFVSDRTFDNLAYAAQHSRVLPLLTQSVDFFAYIKSLKQNDVFMFFIRPSKATLKQDGVREIISWDGIIAIDSMCKFMLELWEIPYYQINTDNIQERIRFVDAVLRR